MGVITDHMHWRGVPVPNQFLQTHHFSLDNGEMPDGAYFAMSEEQGISIEDHAAYAAWQDTIPK